MSEGLFAVAAPVLAPSIVSKGQGMRRTLLQKKSLVSKAIGGSRIFDVWGGGIFTDSVSDRVGFAGVGSPRRMRRAKPDSMNVAQLR